MKKIFILLVLCCFAILNSQQLRAQTWKDLDNINSKYQYVSLAVHPKSGEPYVAFSDSKNSDKASVLRFNGSAWVKVGKVGFSAGSIRHPSLAFHPKSGELYITYQDMENGGTATVMHFNGNDWVRVGKDFSDTVWGDNMTLAFNPVSAELCIAFNEGTEMTVSYFDGTYWRPLVGERDGYLTPSSFNRPNFLAFHPTSGEPYIAYTCNSNQEVLNGQITIKRFTAGKWEVVGTRFCPENLPNNSVIGLAFHPTSKEPYVAYKTGYTDSNNFITDCKITVMRYNGTAWTNVGVTDFQTVYDKKECENFLFHPESGDIYLSYIDKAGNSALKRFNGTTWIDIKTENIGILAFHPKSGDLYNVYNLFDIEKIGLKRLAFTPQKKEKK